MNSTIKPSACKTCGSLYHSAMYHKPRKPLETKKPLVNKRWKPVKKAGKQQQKWMETKQGWMRLHMTTGVKIPCHYCQKPLGADTVTLDHRIPRSRAPELRYDFNNLVPCCFTCNGLKGSVDHNSYQHKCPDNVKETI